jgi:hypothetical protein
MPFDQAWLDVDFGSAHAGLATVGYRLYKNDGTDSVARTTTGVVDLSGTGSYGVANVTVPDDAVGIEWDTGGGSPVYAIESLCICRSLDLLADIGWNKVYIDLENGEAGQEHPIGTAGRPSNNITDARAIAVREKITTFIVRTGEAEIILNDDFEEYEFRAGSPSLARIDINGQNVNKTSFGRLTLEGDLGPQGPIDARGCILADGIGEVQGSFYNCTTEGLVKLAAGTVTRFVNVTAAALTTIDMVGGGRTFVGNGLGGPWKVINTAEGSVSEFGINTGSIFLDVSNGGGHSVLAGVMSVIDNVPVDGMTVDRTAQIEAAPGIFNGKILIDETSEYEGADLRSPIGSEGYPVNNLTDGKALADHYGIRTLFLANGDFTLEENYDGYDFEGGQRFRCSIDLNGQSVDLTSVVRLTIRGSGVGNLTGRLCDFPEAYTDAELSLKDCTLTGPISLAAGKTTVLQGCIGVGGGFTINIGTGTLNMSGFNGFLTVANCTAWNVFYINGDSFILELASSCVAGVAVVQGLGRLTDNSSMFIGYSNVIPASVDDVLEAAHGANSWQGGENVATETELIKKRLFNAYNLSDGKVDNLELLDDDGVTPLATADVTDKNGDPVVLPIGSPAKKGPLE